jgi:hypothetical protein
MRNTVSGPEVEHEEYTERGREGGCRGREGKGERERKRQSQVRRGIRD